MKKFDFGAGKFPGKIIQEIKKEAKKPVDVKLLT